MAKPKKSRTAYSSPRKKVDHHFVGHDLAKVDPLKQQFEPTDANPVPQRKRMAGMG